MTNPFQGIADTLQSVAGNAYYGPQYNTIRDIARQIDSNNSLIVRFEGLRRQAASSDPAVRASAQQELSSSGVIQTGGGSGGEDGGPTITQVNSTINSLRDENDRMLQDLVAIPGGGEFAAQRWPTQYRAIVEHSLDFNKLTTSSGGGGGGRIAAGPSYQFEFAPNGDLYRVGSDGTFTLMDNIPEFAQRNVQVVNDQRTGEAFAIATDNEGNVVQRTSLGQYAFPEIDPERLFQRDIMFRAAELETALGGLELQRRGQLIDAIGTDMSNQIMLGRMVYEEARTRLDTVSTALSERRNERQDILRFGVTQESLRQLGSGETVTRLPFAEQTAALLSMSTGQSFSAEDFELGVTYVDPDQAARDVTEAAQFESPIPGLAAGIQGARQAIGNIFSEPIGDFAITEQLIRQATQGV